jgi:hypothetical protein
MNDEIKKQILLVALGGNALIRTPRILPNPLARSSLRRRPQPFLTPHERQKRDTAAL